MPRMEKFNDSKAFSRLKFLYASNVVVNSKIKLNTVVYDIAAVSYLFFAETLSVLLVSTSKKCWLLLYTAIKYSYYN